MRLLTFKKTNDSIDVLITVGNLSSLVKKNVTVLAQYAPARTALVRISPAQLEALFAEEVIKFADTRRQPKEELTTGSLDISLNKINYSHSCFPAINGDAIAISVKEQLLDTTDIDIKGRYFNSQFGSKTESSHAAVMATIIGGGGNSSPFAKGVAWGSYLTSASYSMLLPDDDSVYQKFAISVQNHSYGTGIENYYGGDAAAYDQNSQNVPALLHVFSSGNVGNTASVDGPYASLQGYANLTGSFKMSKNSLTVGATDSFNRVVPLSSKGPAFDGRVKPELVAFAQDGTSGAAALVSGAAALVQQAFRSTVDSSLPSNALVKAILLNSADDVENPWIDYASGYGALNTYNAVKTVREGRFREDSVLQGEEKLIPLSIPEGIAKAKITLSWTDAPASPNATKALVNDLDATLVLQATSESWLPWVLNAANNPDSIRQVAVRMRDTLNNTEQITLDAPKAGAYVLRIKGSNVQNGRRQSFGIAYQLDSALQFQWTYPTASDPLLANATALVRWQSTMKGTASLDFSYDGLQWQTISSAIDLTQHSFSWKTPDTATIGFLRMRTNAQTIPFVSDSIVFSKEAELEVGFNCTDSFLLYWNKQPVAQYQLYQLGEKYLQPLIRTADTIALVNKQTASSMVYSVAPMVANKPGFKSFGTNYTTQGVGCYVRSFLAGIQDNTAVLNIQLGTLYGIRSLQVLRSNGTGTITLQSFALLTATSFVFTDPGLSSGANHYQLLLTLTNGQTITSDKEVVYYFPHHPVIIYPNPAAQHTPIQIITRTPQEYSLEVYDATGRKIRRETLQEVSQQWAPFRLSKGLYFVTITGRDGSRFTQKLLVY
ncbi:S8 family serine peptidase [Flavisolibacter sp. BT320]|nr:S8 family serine peptidase [Flavisolibacter longurius]